MLGKKLVVVLFVAILSISWIQAAPDLTPGEMDIWRSPLSSGIMTAGIYTQDQIDEFQRINSQGREPVRVHQNVYGSEPSSSTVHHIDDKPAKCACSQSWDKFIPFCIVCVGIIATFICIKTIILVVKTITPIWGHWATKTDPKKGTQHLTSFHLERNAKADVEKGTGEK